MTEKLRQSLSAAIDDEADAFELRRVIDELGRDPGLRSLWDRYHLIGSVLRGDRKPVPPELRERVWQALQAGPDAPAVTTGPMADVSEPANQPPAAAKRHGYLGRYTGLAVAASVAFAVVLGFSGIWSDGELPGGGIAASDQAGMVAGPSPALSMPQVSGPRVDLGTVVSDSDVQRAQAYMLHHTQQQAINQAGVIPFVKLATYEAP